MTDFGRLIRYVIPGSIAVILYAFWAFLDHQACATCEPGASLSNANRAGVWLAAASLPVGFLCSVIAAQLIWWPRWLTRIDNEAIIRRQRGAFRKLDLPNRTNAPKRLISDSVIVTLALQRAGEVQGFEGARSRAVSHIDLNNGLANATVAGSLAVIAMLASWGAGLIWLDDFSVSRLWALVIPVASSAFAAGLFRVNQRRVCLIAETLTEVCIRAAGRARRHKGKRL